MYFVANEDVAGWNPVIHTNLYAPVVQWIECSATNGMMRVRILPDVPLKERKTDMRNAIDTHYI